MRKILHLITNTFMVKVHAIFENNEDFEHFYVYPKYNPRAGIKFLQTGTQILKNIKPDNSVVINHPKEFTQTDFNKIKSLIEKHNIQKILLTNPNINGMLIKYLGQHPEIKYYFANHGIVNQDAMNQIINLNRINDHVIWAGFEKIFVTPTEKRQWKTNPKYQEGKNMIMIPGLTQIDFLNTIDQSKYKELIFNHLDSNGFLTDQVNPLKDSPPKSILFLTNKNNSYNLGQQDSETRQIFNFLDKYCEANGIQLFIKLKHISCWTKKYHGSAESVPIFKKKHITPILYNENNCDIPLYYLLFCDAVVVQNYGTSLIESLIVNPNTIRCQFIKKDNQALMDGHPKLHQAFTTTDLESQLELILNSKYPTEESEIQRINFLKEILGNDFQTRGKSSDILLSHLQ